MYAIDLGLFPFAGLLTGGLLYAVYYWGMRLKCSARAGQAYILLTMVVTTVFSVLSMARTTERDLPEAQMEDLPREAWKSVMYHNERYPYEGYVPTLADVADAAAHERPAVMQDATPDATALAAQQPSVAERWQTTIEVLFANALQLLGVLWLLGIVAVMGYFFVQLAYLYWYRHKQKRTGRDGRAVIYETPSGTLPFSFGRNVFMPAAMSDDVRQHVLMHELSHVRHRHFLKLCLLELVLAINWWNPFVWLMFGEMRMQQEMEVDTDVLRQGVDRQAYQLSLVSVCTQQGKWILMQSAFLGGPLKKRLLFMNTPINPRRAQVLIATTLAAACLMLVLMVTVSCRARQRAKTHPLEGCWEMEWLRDTGQQYESRFGQRNLKFFGDYGELVLTYYRSDGVNIPLFSISGMDQRVRNDTLLDVHGHPIEYRLKDEDHLIWRWRLLPGEEADRPEGIDQTEQWRRIKPERELTDMLRTLSEADQTQALYHGLNGVWLQDSVVTVGAEYVTVRTYNKQEYLIMSAPYYMHVAIHPSVNSEVWNFAGQGDCGLYSLSSNGYVTLQNTVYEVHGDERRLVLSTSERRNDGTGVCHYFYHREPMPKYLHRIFRPALAVADAEEEQDK